MKNKYIDTIFIGILLCILLSLAFIGPNVVAKGFNTKRITFEVPTFSKMNKTSTISLKPDNYDKMTQHEKNIIAREAHEKFPNLVDALLSLRSKGFLNYDDISRIHQSLENYQPNITTEVPYSDKDLLEYLYDNNLITKAQFEQILNLIDKES